MESEREKNEVPVEKLSFLLGKVAAARISLYITDR